jgi:ApbE superfamily uncharacterized protein (UPF0280 family)
MRPMIEASSTRLKNASRADASSVSSSSRPLADCAALAICATVESWPQRRAAK